jgi:DNA-binding transcriptional LysR family regulator
LLDGLRRDVPGVSVRMVELAWPQQATAVRDGVVDASLMRPPVSDMTGLRFDVVRHEPKVVALPSHHHLADRTAVELTDLDTEVHVTDDEADPAWVRFWACDPRPSGIPVRYGPSVHTMDELLQAVASGEAIAITSQFVADSHRHPEVTFVPLPEAEPGILALCTRAADTSPLVAGLRRAARTLLETDVSRTARPGR